MTASPVPLTSLARSAGCAAKIGQADLIAALARLPRDAAEVGCAPRSAPRPSRRVAQRAQRGLPRPAPPSPPLPKIGIGVGGPLTFDACRDAGPTAKARRAVTDDVMKAIQALSGQEYVPIYASVRKAQLNGDASAASG